MFFCSFQKTTIIIWNAKNMQAYFDKLIYRFLSEISKCSRTLMKSREETKN